MLLCFRLDKGLPEDLYLQADRNASPGGEPCRIPNKVVVQVWLPREELRALSDYGTGQESQETRWDPIFKHEPVYTAGLGIPLEAIAVPYRDWACTHDWQGRRVGPKNPRITAAEWEELGRKTEKGVRLEGLRNEI